MTFGFTPWGLGPWGGAAPVIDLVSTPWGRGIIGGGGIGFFGGGGPSGEIVDVRGGDVITIGGSGFYDPMTVEILDSNGVVGTCYIFAPRYDVTKSRIYCGTPALPRATYDLRVTSEAGSSTLAHALSYEPIADQMKVERVRIGFSQPWLAGRRLLRGGV